MIAYLYHYNLHTYMCSACIHKRPHLVGIIKLFVTSLDNAQERWNFGLQTYVYISP